MCSQDQMPVVSISAGVIERGPSLISGATVAVVRPAGVVAVAMGDCRSSAARPQWCLHREFRMTIFENANHWICSSNQPSLQKPGEKPSVYLCDGCLLDSERAGSPSINACEGALESCALSNDFVPGSILGSILGLSTLYSKFIWEVLPRVSTLVTRMSSWLGTVALTL
jgi:hypothetical protein